MPAATLVAFVLGAALVPVDAKHLPFKTPTPTASPTPVHATGPVYRVNFRYPLPPRPRDIFWLNLSDQREKVSTLTFSNPTDVPTVDQLLEQGPLGGVAARLGATNITHTVDAPCGMSRVTFTYDNLTVSDVSLDYVLAGNFEQEVFYERPRGTTANQKILEALRAYCPSPALNETIVPPLGWASNPRLSMQDIWALAVGNDTLSFYAGRYSADLSTYLRVESSSGASGAFKISLDTTASYCGNAGRRIVRHAELMNYRDSEVNEIANVGDTTFWLSLRHQGANDHESVNPALEQALATFCPSGFTGPLPPTPPPTPNPTPTPTPMPACPAPPTPSFSSPSFLTSSGFHAITLPAQCPATNFGAWMRGASNNGDVIFIVGYPTARSLDQVRSQTERASVINHMRILSRANIRVCNDTQDAWQVELSGANLRFKNQATFVSGPHGWFAITYVRPDSSPYDKSATQLIQSFCAP